MIAARISLAAAALFAGISAAAAMDTAPNDVMVVDGVVSKSLTGKPGDVAEGRKAFANRKLGNCLACHANSDMSEQLFHGEVGPPLDGVASRWSEEELRAIVVNSKAVFGEQTVMPGFYSLEVGQNVREDLIGKTILTAEQVESIVAYLGTLK
jgi:sulfur-oxidizing protein SoxX